MITNHYKSINQDENMTTINMIEMPILMLQDEPIRETRENLIPFRRMIKGRKSSKLGKILDLTNFGFQHWHNFISFLLLLKLVLSLLIETMSSMTMLLKTQIGYLLLLALVTQLLW